MAAKVKVVTKFSERLIYVLNPINFLEQTEILNAIDNNVKDIFGEIIKSSPVDTGEYQLSWTKTYTKTGTRHRWTIRNTAEHARFLIYGMDINFRRFIRTSRGLTGKSYKYPDTTRGIIHDVRRIIWLHRDKLLKDVQKLTLSFDLRSRGLKARLNLAAFTAFNYGERYR